MSRKDRSRKSRARANRARRRAAASRSQKRRAEVTDAERKAQQARSKQYGIKIKAGGNVNKPANYKTVPDGRFGDPVNYRYPLNPPIRAANAIKRFNNSANRTKGGYSTREWTIIGRRVAKANKGKVHKKGAIVDRKTENLVKIDLPLHKVEAIAMLDGEKSKGDELSEISRAFNETFGREPNGKYIDDVWLPHSNIFEEHVVGVFGRELFQIGYTITDEGVEFESKDEWVEVEQRFAPVKESSRLHESLPRRMSESLRIKIIEAKKGKEGKEWEVVIIGPDDIDEDVIVDGEETYVRSKNGRLYNVKGLEESVELWADAKVYDNHLTDEEFIAKQGMRSVRDELVGIITDPQWIAEDFSIVAILKIIDVDLRGKLKEADEQGVLHTIGLSIDAIGQGDRKKIKSLDNKEFHVIDKIIQAISVDIVAEPAAGGRLERMVASIKKQEGYTVDPKELKKLIEETIEASMQPYADRIQAIEEALTADEEEATEAAVKLAAKHKIDLAKGDVEGTGEDGQITEADVQKFVDAQETDDGKATDEAVKLAADNDVDLAKSEIEGTGDEGIITEADVQKFIDALAASGDDPDPVAEAISKIEKDYADKFQALDDKEALRESEAILKTKMTDSGLPEDFQKIIHERFAGKIFTEKDIDKVIDAQMLALERISESGAVRMPSSQITVGGVTPLDRYELAFLRMVAGSTRFNEIMSEVHQDTKKENPFGAGRFSESVRRYVKDGRPALPRVLRLSEWYYDITGDLDAMGVLNPEFMRVPEALVNTATVTSIVKNTLNLLLAADYSVRERWWEPIVRQEDVDTLDDATLVRVHGMDNLSGMNEGQTYTELDWEDEEETASYKKRGNYVGITLETFLQDKLNVLRTIPMRLSNSWYNTVSALVSAVFTVNSAAGPVLADTGALFNATALTTTGGHANLLTTGLSYAQFLTIRTAMKKQTDQPLGVGRRLVDNRPKFALIPVDILGIAEEIRDSELVPGEDGGATSGGEMQTRNSVRGSFEIIEVPDWTDVNNYAIVADPVRYPAIWLIWLRGRRTPELFSADDERSGAMFSNDEIRMKIRMFGFRFSSTYDCAPVSDWRPLHKSNV